GGTSTTGTGAAGASSQVLKTSDGQFLLNPTTGSFTLAPTDTTTTAGATTTRIAKTGREKAVEFLMQKCYPNDATLTANDEYNVILDQAQTLGANYYAPPLVSERTTFQLFVHPFAPRLEHRNSFPLFPSRRVSSAPAGSGGGGTVAGPVQEQFPIELPRTFQWVKNERFGIFEWQLLPDTENYTTKFTVLGMIVQHGVTTTTSAEENTNSQNTFHLPKTLIQPLSFTFADSFPKSIAMTIGDRNSLKETIFQIFFAIERPTSESPGVEIDFPIGFGIEQECWAFNLPDENVREKWYKPFDSSTATTSASSSSSSVSVSSTSSNTDSFESDEAAFGVGKIDSCAGSYSEDLVKFVGSNSDTTGEQLSSYSFNRATLKLAEKLSPGIIYGFELVVKPVEKGDYERLYGGGGAGGGAASSSTASTVFTTTSAPVSSATGSSSTTTAAKWEFKLRTLNKHSEPMDETLYNIPWSVDGIYPSHIDPATNSYTLTDFFTQPYQIHEFENVTSPSTTIPVTERENIPENFLPQIYFHDPRPSFLTNSPTLVVISNLKLFGREKILKITAPYGFEWDWDGSKISDYWGPYWPTQGSYRLWIDSTLKEEFRTNFTSSYLTEVSSAGE
ncbi:unnamed protein product, partial [Amoebophrya sp. A120]